MGYFPIDPDELVGVPSDPKVVIFAGALAAWAVT